MALELTSETCTVDVLHSVVGNEESFLPSHEDGPAVAIWHGQVGSLELILDVAERREALPVHHVFLLVGAPLLRQKTIAAAYDFCVKISCQLRPIISQSTYTEVAAEKR